MQHPDISIYNYHIYNNNNIVLTCALLPYHLPRAHYLMTIVTAWTLCQTIPPLHYPGPAQRHKLFYGVVLK